MIVVRDVVVEEAELYTYLHLIYLQGALLETGLRSTHGPGRKVVARSTVADPSFPQIAIGKEWNANKLWWRGARCRGRQRAARTKK